MVGDGGPEQDSSYITYLGVLAHSAVSLYVIPTFAWRCEI